ncbi:MAG: HDOD domain-containing protein [Hydrogenophaga sp.]|uniref:serine/threonine protein kinase n=1 Tax=Hydrogenophaga sp. TaxID=1904254 RepID=UPI0027339735|nr:serine/threonine protein kinase [Hydrogenophaga sp.]MDP3629207.1 HDOD domain-containing protein [Hydrogenophaga sp.]
MSPLSTFQNDRGPAAALPEPKMGDSLGRFQLRRLIGQGGQATVWLAFDPRLEREVAIKLLRPERGADAAVVTQWLQEARSVSRLTHPNIIPVFEADVQEQQPYLVFEYVPGQTLAQVLQQRGALPPAEAVGLMIDVLEALVAAHAAGIVHRDLKPSNVLVEASGRARVMDFGIAVRVQESEGQPAPLSAPKATGGTPGYMSPEAATGAPPTPAMDLFSAAIVLTEMISGQRLIDERDPWRAMQRVALEDLPLPAELGNEADDALRAILLRGLARDPRQRHPSAQVFLDELKKWWRPVTTPLSDVDEKGSSGTVEFLLRRMRHKSDFPAMSGSIVRIQSISSSDRESVATLTNEILKDVALTNKLLRLVNTAQYARGGPINTVSRAVTLVGFNGIRNMALSLVLLEHMQDKAHANLLKEEFLRSLMAGAIALELSPVRSEGEEAFLGAMFQNLGRLLTEYYFPEEARAVRALMSGKETVPEDSAAITVLGISYERLGVGISKAWHLPDTIQNCMRKPTGPAPTTPPKDLTDRLRWIALASNEMADTLLHTEPKSAQVRLAQLGQRYARSIGIDSKGMETATQRAREKLVELARAMEFKVAPGTPAARLLQTAPPGGKAPHTVTLHEPFDGDAFHDSVGSFELHATQPVTPEQIAALALESQRVAEMLAAGIQDITNAMVEDFKLSDILRMILETMYRAMGFRQIVFCMRDAKKDALTGRFGLGPGVEQIVKSFDIPLHPEKSNLFSAVCIKGADTMISDAGAPRVADRLPAWYRDAVYSPSFLLLPLMLKGAPFGLIYADKGDLGELQLGEKELALLRTLRNQAVMAFRQSS